MAMLLWVGFGSCRQTTVERSCRASEQIIPRLAKRSYYSLLWDFDGYLLTLQTGDSKMQKKLIGLAVAGLVSSGAFAQSNVTISGVVDLAISQYSGSSPGVANGVGSTTRMENGQGWGSSQVSF